MRAIATDGVISAALVSGSRINIGPQYVGNRLTASVRDRIEQAFNVVNGEGD
jgi:hypothetical protein